MPYQHEMTARIYAQETDAQGIVYHGNYLVLAERARDEYFRSRDTNFVQHLISKGLFPVIRHADIEYLHAARYDDLVRIVSYVDHIGNSSFVMPSDMFIGDKHITTVKVTLVLVNRDLKATPLTDEMKEFLQ